MNAAHIFAMVMLAWACSPAAPSPDASNEQARNRGGGTTGVSVSNGAEMGGDITAEDFDISRFMLPENLVSDFTVVLSSSVLLSYVTKCEMDVGNKPLITIPLNPKSSITDVTSVRALMIVDPGDDSTLDVRRVLLNEDIIVAVDHSSVTFQAQDCSMMNSGYLITTTVPEHVGYQPYFAKLRFTYTVSNQAYYVSNENGSWQQQHIHQFSSDSLVNGISHDATDDDQVFFAVSGPQGGYFRHLANGLLGPEQSIFVNSPANFAAPIDITARGLGADAQVFIAYNEQTWKAKGLYRTSSGAFQNITLDNSPVHFGYIRTKFAQDGSLRVISSGNPSKILTSHSFPPASFSSKSFNRDLYDEECSGGSNAYAFDVDPTGSVYVLYVCRPSGMALGTNIFGKFSATNILLELGWGIGATVTSDIVADDKDSGIAAALSVDPLGIMLGSIDQSVNSWATITENIEYSHEFNKMPYARLARDKFGILHLLVIQSYPDRPPRIEHFTNGSGEWKMAETPSAAIFGKMSVSKLTAN